MFQYYFVLNQNLCPSRRADLYPNMLRMCYVSFEAHAVVGDKASMRYLQSVRSLSPDPFEARHPSAVRMPGRVE